MEFREINEKELDILLELYKILNAKDYHQLPSREEVEKIWIIIQKSEYFKIFVIEEENKIVSSCTFSLIPNLTRGARPYGIIENVITHPEHRKQGFGTHLLKKTLKHAWKNKCYKVMLLTGKKDPYVHKFYENAGFIKGIKTGFIARNY